MKRISNRSDFVRKLVVLLILAIFIGYCLLAYRCQTWYEIPDYEPVTIDILDGMTAAEWSQLPEPVRRDRLASLAGKRFQLISPLRAGGISLQKGQILKARDYAAFLSAGIYQLRMLDPAPLFSFIKLRLKLRQDVKAADGTVIGKEGLPVNKKFIDAYLAAAKSGKLKQEPGHENQVAVVGSGQVVGFNATIFMVILIFVAMVLVLEKIFWQPMMEFIDARTGEIRKGAECSRSNRTEAERIDLEYRQTLRQLHKECQKRLREERQRTFEHADLIVSKAWREMKEMRETAQEEIKEAFVKAEAGLRSEIPALVEAIENRIKKSSQGA